MAQYCYTTWRERGNLFQRANNVHKVGAPADIALLCEFMQEGEYMKRRSTAMKRRSTAAWDEEEVYGRMGQ